MSQLLVNNLDTSCKLNELVTRVHLIHGTCIYTSCSTCMFLVTGKEYYLPVPFLKNHTTPSTCDSNNVANTWLSPDLVFDW